MAVGAPGPTMELAAKAVEEEGKLGPGEILEIGGVCFTFLGVAQTQDRRVVGKPVRAALSNRAIATPSAVVCHLFLIITRP